MSLPAAPGQHRDERGQERPAGEAADRASDRIAARSEAHVLVRRPDRVAANGAGDELKDEIDDRH